MTNTMVQCDNDSKHLMSFLRYRSSTRKTTTNSNNHSDITRRKIRYNNKKRYNTFRINQWFVNERKQPIKQWPIRQDFIIWFIMIITSLILLILLIRAMVQLSIEIRPIVRYFTIYSIFGNTQGSLFNNNTILSKIIKWICSWYIRY